MKPSIPVMLRRELAARGYLPAAGGDPAVLVAPHGSMSFGDDYTTPRQLVDLLEMLVRRRERLNGSFGTIDPVIGKNNYDDAVVAVEAVKGALVALLDE